MNSFYVTMGSIENSFYLKLLACSNYYLGICQFCFPYCLKKKESNKNNGMKYVISKGHINENKQIGSNQHRDV